MEHLDGKQKYRFWQAAWWRANSERGKWAATLAALALLLAGGVYLDQRSQARSELAAIPESQPQVVAAEQTEPQPLQQADIPKPEPEAPALQAPPAQPQAAIEEPEAALPVWANALTLVSPVAESEGGAILRGYGYSWDPTTEDYRFHHGVDLALLAGGSVYAAAAGTVVEAGGDAFWGGVVIIEHGPGWQSVYKGVEAAVAAGDQVQAGTLLGRQIISQAELAQESHVHIEVLVDGKSQDPAPYLPARP